MTPELSYLLPLSELGEEEAVIEIAADAEARQALARRFDLVALEALSATLRVRRTPSGRVLVRGRLDARVVQSCVVTLEPVTSEVSAEVARTYAEDADADEGEIVVDAFAEEIVEPLPVEALELGEAVAEEFGLAIDPYPRKPGAVLAVVEATEPTPVSPFAVLARLRRDA